MANEIEIKVTGNKTSADTMLKAVGEQAEQTKTKLRGMGEGAESAFEKIVRSATGVKAQLAEVDRQLRELAHEFNRTGNVKLLGDMSNLRQVRSELESVSRELGHVENQAHSTGRGMGIMGASVASTIGNMAANVASNLASMAFQATKSLVTFGVESAANMQTARVSFDLMLGSAEKSKAFLADLQKFAVVTPFELQDLQTYASRLLSVGTNASSIIPMLRHIGDATAAVGTGSFGIERAVNALNNMKLAGDVSMIHLKELAFAGVPIFDALAAKLHTTTAKVVEMVSQNKIKVQDVFDAVEHGTGASFARINGMMDKQSATLAGKWSNLKDSAQQTFGHLFEPAIPGLSRLVDAIGKDIPKIIADMKGFAKAVGENATFQRIVAALKELGEKALPFVKKEFADLVKTIKDNREGLEKFGKFVADVIVPIVGMLLAGAFHTIVASIETTIMFIAELGEAWDKLKGPIGAIAHFMVAVLLGAFGGILHGAALAFSWIPGLGPKLAAADKAFQGFVKGVNNAIDMLTKDTKIHIDAYFRAHDFPVGGATTRSNRVFQAAGGITPANGAATGGIRSRLVEVGEHGRELLELPPGTRVHSNPDTERMLGGGGAMRTELTFAIDRRADTVFASMFQRLLDAGMIVVRSKHVVAA